MSKEIFKIIEESKFNLFTKTVCPKCLLIKSSLDNAGVLEEVNIINLDENPEVKEWIQTNEGSKNISSLPILEAGGKFIVNQNEIMSTVINSQ